MDRTTPQAAPDSNAVDGEDEARPQPNAPFAQGAPQTDDDAFEAEADDEATPEPTGGPTPNAAQEEAEALRQQLRAAEAEREHLRQQAQQAAQERALAAWQQAELQHEQNTGGMDAYEKAQADRAFYKQREAYLMNVMQQTQAQANQYQQFLAVQQQAQGLVQEYGLESDDAESLMALGALDPSRMQAEAKRRAATNKKFADLEKKIEKANRGQQRQQRINSGAERVGGGGGPLPARQSFTGSLDELAEIASQSEVLRSYIPRK